MKKRIFSIIFLSLFAMLYAIMLASCAEEEVPAMLETSAVASNIRYDAENGISTLTVEVTVENLSEELDASGFAYKLYFYDGHGNMLHEELVSYPSESLSTGDRKSISDDYSVSGGVGNVAAVPYSMSVETESPFITVLSNIIVFGIAGYIIIKVFFKD